MKKKNRLIFYMAHDEQSKVRLQSEGNNVWATAEDMARIFGVKVQAIYKHIKAIYKDGEQDPIRTCSSLEQVRIEGGRRVTRMVDHYSLEMTNAVAFKVQGKVAKKFRYWAAKKLKDVMLPPTGFTQPALTQENIIEFAIERAAAKTEIETLTDAIQEHLIADYGYTAAQAGGIFAKELDMLNVIVYGMTAKKWKKLHPELDAKGNNMRDLSQIENLKVLQHLQIVNAAYIDIGLNHRKRKQMLTERAKAFRLTLKNSLGLEMEKLPKKVIKEANKKNENSQAEEPQNLLTDPDEET